MTKATIQMTPGDDVHLTLLMAPHSLNFFTGQDREHLLAFGRAAFEAGKATAEQGKCLHQIAEPAAAQAVQAAVPGVCVLVPVDPTEEMEQAAADYLGECVKAWGLWKAMLAAAPAHPAEGVPAPMERSKARIAELESVLAHVQEEFKKFGDSFPDGFDWRLFRFVDDTIAATHPTQQGLDATRTTPVVLGAKLFSFSSMQDWINGAQRRWKQARVSADRTICLDQKGRVLQKGLEFMRAEKEGVFPVDVYLALVDDTLRYEAAQAKQGGA